MSKLTKKLRRNAKKNGNKCVNTNVNEQVEKHLIKMFANYYNGNRDKILDVFAINSEVVKRYTTSVFTSKRLPDQLEVTFNDNIDDDIINNPDFIPLMTAIFEYHSHIGNYLTNITVYELDDNNLDGDKYRVQLTFNYKPNTNWMTIFMLFAKDLMNLGQSHHYIHHTANIWQNMGITAEDIKALLDNYKLSPNHINMLQNILNTPEYMTAI